jgi:hypothetical protein
MSVIEMLRQSPRAQGVPFDRFTSYLHSFELVQTQKGIITVGGGHSVRPMHLFGHNLGNSGLGYREFTRLIFILRNTDGC